MNEPSTETRSVVVEREFPFPPEKIWRALTQPHLIEEWLMQNDFMPAVGHRFNLRRSPRPDMNIGGIWLIRFLTTAPTDHDLVNHELTSIGIEGRYS